jgi:hypothetical protein
MDRKATASLERIVPARVAASEKISDAPELCPDYSLLAYESKLEVGGGVIVVKHLDPATECSGHSGCLAVNCNEGLTGAKSPSGDFMKDYRAF